jgi:hypothetical protein
MRALLTVARREAGEALAAAEHYLGGRHEVALRVLALGISAKARLLGGGCGAATADLDDADDLARRSDIIPPWHSSTCTTARLQCLAEEAGRGTGSRDSARIRRAIRNGLRVASCVAGARPETHRLVARLYAAQGRQRRAHRHWQLAIDAGTQLDALPELARTLVDRAHLGRIPEGTGQRDADLGRARAIYRQLGLPDATSDPAGVS